jgi:bisphosphoglycerate-dependent phosphoglycerate mutase
MDGKMNKNSLEEYGQERIKDMRNQYEGIKFLESSNKATLSGRPAYKLVYLRRSSDGKSLVKRIEIFTIANNRVYIVNGGSEAKYYSEVLPGMISSFGLTTK